MYTEHQSSAYAMPGIIPQGITIFLIKQQVAKENNITPEAINARTRLGIIKESRHISMFLTHRFLSVTTKETGRLHGNFDHATVLHACKQVSHHYRYNKEFRQKLCRIMFRLGLDHEQVYKRLNLQ